ncbi:MAG TPA: alginate lyase family protein [Thermomicrobiales bacterium]|jgi:uncharacterized heparinase superfamily protein
MSVSPGVVFARGRRYADTLRYLSAGQVAHRALRIARRRSGFHGASARPALAVVSDPPVLYVGLPFVRGGAWEVDLRDAIETAESITRGRFHFLGQTWGPSTESLPWHDPRLSQLWRYHLHYFDYVRDLSLLAAGDADSRVRDVFVRLAEDWIAANPPAAGDGWHPYTVSLRLVNWIHAAQHLLGADTDSPDPFLPRLLASMAQQARYLARNLELDVRGNHLLENLRALLACAHFFAGAEPARWRKLALRHLEREIAEQILPDGGHFERSPGYHLVVLRILLECALLLERGDSAAPPWLTGALVRMLDYLVGILPPDGQVPLLKDTAWDAAPAPVDLLAAGAIYLDTPRWKRHERLPLYPALLFGEGGERAFSRWPVERTPVPTTAFPSTAHYVMRDDARGDHLILDAGKPCPDYLPAHAHADLLSYELTVANARIVVDSGVYEYAPGSWRDYFRSTRAHSTVEVAGANQSEVWGSFRVGRRARPGPVMWRESDDGATVWAEHDGYRRLPVPVTHRRTVIWRRGRYWIVLDDVLGAGEVPIANHIHLHPSITPVSDGDSWRLEGAPVVLWITPFAGCEVELTRGRTEPTPQGWYSERFGERRPNQVLTLRAIATLPFRCGYVIARDAPAAIASGDAVAGRPPVVTHRGEEHVLVSLEGGAT